VRDDGPLELERHVDAYLAIRVAVGLTNTRHGRGLRDFIAYAKNTGAADGSPIRAATAVSWAWDHAPTMCGIRGRGDRLIVVRGFLNYLAAVIPGTEVPGSRVIAVGRRRRPYVFSDEEMMTLINSASRPNPRVLFRPTVLSTMLGLLATTGLRVGEACRLTMADVRLGDAHPHLQILQTKLHKSRIVPIHATVVAALSGYLEERRAHECDTWGDRLFVNRDGRPLDVHDLGRWFASLCQSLGIEPVNTHDRRPCLTSFRHAFAVRRLCEWHSAGLDVQSLPPTLAVYLGHVGPESSYWYLSATPDLLRAVGARFTLDRSAGGEG
jgi:integrase/recombinase XerD